MYIYNERHIHMTRILSDEYFRFMVDTSEVHTKGIKQWLHLDAPATVLASKVAMCFERLSEHHMTMNTPDTRAFTDLTVALKCLLVRMTNNIEGCGSVVTVCRNIRQNCVGVAFIGLMNTYAVKLLNDDEFDENRCRILLHIAWAWMRNQATFSRCTTPSAPRMLESDAKSSNHLLSVLLTKYNNKANLHTHIQTQCVDLCTRILSRTYILQPSGPVFNLTNIKQHTTSCAQTIQDALQDYSVVHQHMWGWLQSTRNIGWFSLESTPRQSTQTDEVQYVSDRRPRLVSYVFWLKSLSAHDNELVYKSAMTGLPESSVQPALTLLYQLLGCHRRGNPVGRSDTELKSDWKRMCDGESISRVGIKNNRKHAHIGPLVSDIVTVLSPDWRRSCAIVHASTLFLLGLNLLRVAVSLIGRFDEMQMTKSNSSISQSLLQECFQHAYEATLCMCAVQHTQGYTSDAPLHGIVDSHGVVSQIAHVCVLFTQEVTYKMQTLNVPFIFTPSIYTENVFRVAKLDACNGFHAYLLLRFSEILKAESPLDISAYRCLQILDTEH
jgi:hypothetical protein